MHTGGAYGATGRTPEGRERLAHLRNHHMAISRNPSQSVAISPHYRHQPSVRLVIRQGIKEANAPFEGAKRLFKARLLRRLADTKVARCAQLGFVEALCTSEDDQRGHQRPSEAIRSHQRPSKVIRGHQRSSEVIRGHQRPSEVIRGHQRSLEAIRGHQRPSEAIRGHQRPSEAS